MLQNNFRGRDMLFCNIKAETLVTKRLLICMEQIKMAASRSGQTSAEKVENV